LCRGRKYVSPCVGGTEKVLKMFEEMCKRRKILVDDQLKITNTRSITVPKSALLMDGRKVALFDYKELLAKHHGMGSDRKEVCDFFCFIQRSPLSSVGRAPGF
jgi:hypothetical protein